MVLEKTLESPLDCKEIQPVHCKGDQPGISLEGMMLKLKLQYFGHLMGGADSLEKTWMLGKIEGRKRRGWQRMRRLDGITDSMDLSLSEPGSWWWTGRPGMLQFMGSQRVWRDWATELNWNENSTLPSVHTLKLGTCNTAYLSNTQENHVKYNIITKLTSKIKNMFNMMYKSKVLGQT